MRERIGPFLLVALFLGVASFGIGLTPRTARAYHTYQTRLLDSTAYSLHRRGVRLGLMKLSYGIIDQLQVTTYTMPWLLGVVLQDVAPNLELKTTFYDRRRLALSGSIAFIEGQVTQTDLSTMPPSTSKARYLLVPMEVASSVRINPRISTHLGGQFTFTNTLGKSEPGGTEIEGAAVINILQVWGMLEWRLSRIAAFTLTVRWAPYVSNVVVKGELDIDRNTDAIIGIEIDVVDLNNAAAIIPGFVFSWDRANLRVGVGYGDLFVKSLGLIVPQSTLSRVSAEFDVFVRF